MSPAARFGKHVLAGTFLVVAAPVLAQEAANVRSASDGIGAVALEEIIVTARRKDERLQDVPTTINVVTAEDLNRLNIREFSDIQTIMPGLSLQESGASVRGIAFNQLASGSNGTIAFYLNDSPLPATNLFQVMYDIGQVELLRGPQGTLRGRATPSGSMTVTTRRADLGEFGGYVNTTATDSGGYNVNGAVNLPIVRDRLAVRLAALIDDNDGTTVDSVNNSLDPFDRTKSARATVRFEPTDNLSFNLTYQRLESKARRFTQVESLQAIDPAAPPSPTFVRGSDYSAVQDTPATNEFTLDITNLQAQWAFGGQLLSYVGSINKSTGLTQNVADTGDFFGPTAPAFLQGYGNLDNITPETDAHELRLSSEERVFGFLDYVVGGFYMELDSPTTVQQASAIVIPAPVPGNPGRIVTTPLLRTNHTEEKSAFANLTAHIGEALEVSAGARYIEYQAQGGVVVNGAPLAAAAQDDDFDTTIYSGSVKYTFNESLMAYASVGTSWRPGITVIGDFSLAPSPLELSFINLPPEESTSYEMGLKWTGLDNRMRLNLAVFHQDFDNYPWRTPSPVYYVETALNTATTPPTPFERVTPFNFVGAVPVEVNGLEAEWTWAASERWDIGLNASYAKSEIDNGLVPCNDYSPHDGVPDTNSSVPTVTQIKDASNGGTITGCTVDYRASQAPLWSAAMQSEYRIPFNQDIDGYVRGLYSFYGDSQNDPTSMIDDVDSYGLLNLYLGVRSRSGAWEVSIYGKNLTEEEIVLTRDSTPLTTSYRVLATASTGVSTYRRITATEPREFGLNVRYSFGSR